MSSRIIRLYRRSRRYIVLAVGVLVLAFGAIQLVPYGRDHDNPPVLAEPAWDTPLTRALAAQACFDCHSNETHWPWYSNIAPISWWTQDHVDEGRDELNFSEWNWSHDDIDEIAESVMENEMPPNYYKPWNRLSDTEREQLIRGLIWTFNYADENTDRDD